MDFQELLAGYKTDQMLYVCLYMRDFTNQEHQQEDCLFLCSYYRCCSDVEVNTNRQHYSDNSVGVVRMYTSKQCIHLIM